MHNLSEFNKELDKIGLKIEVAVNDLSPRAAVLLVKKLAPATPIDTGDAMSNWQVSSGSPAEGVRDAFSKGSQGSTRSENIEAAIADAEAKVLEHTPGQSLWVCNNLDYIRDLNAGWNPATHGPGSPQQPDPGWVEDIVDYVGQLLQEQGLFRVLSAEESGPGLRPLDAGGDFAADDEVPF